MALPPVTVYRTPSEFFAQRGEDFFRLDGDSVNEMFLEEDPAAWLADRLPRGRPVAAPGSWLPPIQSQEVWAAGVTYRRSRDARMVEAHDAGGGTFYDRVYDAVRPEIFFKATPHRVAGHGQAVRIRSDSHWNVPEPEVALAINSRGRIFGYTIGNDMSSRDIEGENPLYLPQAKTYTACCGLGPGIVVRETLPETTRIELEIQRGLEIAFTGHTSLDRMKRTFTELAEFLFRDNDFPYGAFLLTGTGIVPPTGFTLQSGDVIRIRIDHLGTLENRVA